MGTVYLLGAGFTRAILESAPLNNEVMPNINVSNYPELINIYEATQPDIERFLTFLDLELNNPQKSENEVEALRGAYNDIYNQIASQFDVDKLGITDLADSPILANFIETIPACSHILTINYDCVLDQGLWLSGVWSPAGGYTLSDLSDTRDNDYKKNIKLMKLHGSVNFRQRASNYKYPLIEISPRYFNGIPSHLNIIPESTSFVVLMSFIKIYRNASKLLWREAINALKNAERLIVIGCSLRNEDLFLQFALYHFGMKPGAKTFYIDVVDLEDGVCAVKNKITSVVANPTKCKINCFRGGLRGYIKLVNSSLSRQIILDDYHSPV